MTTYNFHGYSTSAVAYNEATGQFDFAADYDFTTDHNDTRTAHTNHENVSCFPQGTTLRTAEGEQAVDWIRAGDRVMTKDHGFQKVLWVERTIISANNLASTPSLRPIAIAAQSIDAKTPTRDLILPPDHRVLLKSHQTELLFGTDEVFAPIKAFENGGNIAQVLPQHDISYYHILFKNHEVVLAEGLWVESFFPGIEALASLPAKMQARIHNVLEGKTDKVQTARICLKPWEAKLLAPQNASQAIPCLSVA